MPSRAPTLNGLRILHVAVTIDRGGCENHLRDLVEQQLDGGAEVACAYLKGGDYWREDMTKRGARVVALGMASYGDPRPAARLRKLVSEWRPDIVHAHGAAAEIYALVAKSKLTHRPRLVFSRHEPRTRLFLARGYDAVDRVVTRAADRVIAISNAIKEVDVRRRPQLEPKEHVAHYGFDPSFAERTTPALAAETRRGWGIRDGEIVFGTIARHTNEKSLDTLLEAFAAAVAAEDPSAPLRLVMVGKGYLTDELKALSSRLGLGSRVVWEPFRDDVPTVMRAFDVFVLVSKEEGFGLVLLEAMSLERPIVSSRVDAIPEIILDEETGLLGTPRDVAGFTERFLRLARDPELRTRLGRAGRERLEKQFTLRAMVDKISVVYGAALGRA